MEVSDLKGTATLAASSASFGGLLDIQNGGVLQTRGGTVTLSSNVVVELGGEWDLPLGTSVQLNGVLTNLGTMRWVSDFNTFNLQGSGRIENVGLWEIFADPACQTCGFESLVSNPANVPLGGRLLLSTNAVL
jgi:hypothetical protein